MSKIAVKIENIGDTNKCLIPIKKITELSLSEIKNRIQDGHPIVEYELYESDHEIITERLKRLVSEIPQHGCKVKLYEFDTNENYITCPNVDDFEITNEILINILGEFEKEVERQMYLDSELDMDEL